jgi:hypothetical protein
VVTLTQDPSNPDRLILTQTVTLYLDKVLLSSLSAEVEAAIRARAALDLKSNKAVKKQIAAAATAKLLGMLNVPLTVNETMDAVARAANPMFAIKPEPAAVDLQISSAAREVISGQQRT